MWRYQINLLGSIGGCERIDIIQQDRGENVRDRIPRLPRIKCRNRKRWCDRRVRSGQNIITRNVNFLSDRTDRNLDRVLVFGKRIKRRKIVLEAGS